MINKLNRALDRFSNSIVLKKVIFILLVSAFFLFIYDLNLLYPIFADDWDYSYVYWHPERITNFFQIFYSQAIHYVKWGGRSILHGILQTLLFLGPKWSDFLNSLAFVFYIWIMYKISNFGNRIKPSILILIFFAIWFFQANIGETILWLSGSANYLWGTSIILAFIYPYHKYLIEYLSNNQRSVFWIQRSNYLKYSFFFLGMIAGWTNENMAIAMIFMIISIIYIIYRQKRQFEKWAIYGLLGSCIGALIMYMAPGNMVRYKLRLEALGVSNPPPKTFYYDNILSWFHLMLDNLLVLFLVIITLVIIFIIFSKIKNKRIILLSLSLYITGAILATLALILAPEFSDRMFFGIITFLIIVISLIYSNLNFDNLCFKGVVAVCFMISLVYFMQTYKNGRNYLVFVNEIVTDREQQINEQKQEGKQDIVLHTKTFDYRQDLVIPRMIDLPVSDDGTLWMNQAYCRYYGIKSKKIVSP